MATNMARWDPLRDLTSMHDELNRLFGRTFGASGFDEVGEWRPLLDVYETQDQYVINVELPGVKPGDVDVSVEDNILMLRGERRFEREVDEESFHRIERRYGRFVRTVTLPRTADAEAIDARFEDGVLEVRVPKREEAKPRRIEVKAR